MKRKIMSVMALAVSMSLFLTGCDININVGDKPSITENQGNDDPVKDSDKKEVSVEDDNNDNNGDIEDTTDVKEKDLNTPEAVKEAFENFMYNDGTAYCKIGNSEAKDYTLEQMIEAETEVLKEEWYNEDLYSTEKYYDYIDCGLDGIEELVIEVEYCVNPDYDTDLLDKYFIFKVFDGKVTLIDMEEGYCRSCINISKAGGIESCGSGGANLHCYSYSFIDADGEKVFDYSLNMYTDLDRALAPYYDIPGSIRPDDYPYENYNYSSDEIGIECDEYNFIEFDYETYENDYDSYLSGNMFVFIDKNGNDVPVPEQYALFYDEHGIGYYTTDEMTKILSDHENEIGLTEDVRGIGEYIDLKELLN